MTSGNGKPPGKHEIIDFEEIRKKQAQLISKLPEQQKRSYLALERLMRFAEWRTHEQDGVMPAIIESYIQKFVTESGQSVLFKLIIEKLGITQEEISERCITALEATIAHLQLELHVIITPDGVLKDEEPPNVG
jgi:hypothetical protein